MSLKTFHLFFIIVVILFAFGFAAWSFMNFTLPDGRRSDVVCGGVAVAVGIGLIFYEIYFLKKTKNVSYL